MLIDNALQPKYYQLAVLESSSIDELSLFKVCGPDDHWGVCAVCSLDSATPRQLPQMSTEIQVLRAESTLTTSKKVVGAPNIYRNMTSQPKKKYK